MTFGWYRGEFIGATEGTVLGTFLVSLVAEKGVDLSAFSAAFRFFYMNPVIHPALTVKAGLQLAGATLAVAMFSGLYPAWKATRIHPVEMLRSV